MRNNARKLPVSAAPQAKRGRPSRAEELRRLIENVGVDPNLVDPKRVLAAIAIDAEAPAGARVAAAKALLIVGGKFPAGSGSGADDDLELDALSRRAITIMSRRTN